MKFLTLLILLTCSFAFAEQQPDLHVLSVQHSGSMWTLYSLHTMTHRRVGDCNFLKLKAHTPVRDWHRFFRYQAKIDPKKPWIYFSHSFNRFYEAKQAPDKHVDKLLVVLRNPKEWCISLKMKPDAFANQIQSKKLNYFLKNLIKNLEYFDTWPEDTRLLVHFEDLMDKPKETFTRIMRWLGEDSQVVADFMTHYDDHRKRSYQLYKSNHLIRHHANTKSNGKPLFYTKDTDPASLQKIDEAFKTSYPHLWKYFERFQSDE